MPLTLSQELGRDLAQQAEQRGQTIEEYVASLTDAVHHAPERVQSAIADIAEQESVILFSDDEARELLAVSQVENLLPQAWIQAWRESDDESRSKFIAAAIIGLVIFLLIDPEAKRALTDLLKRLSVVARILREEEETRPTEAPEWLSSIRPANPVADGTNGLQRVIGAWPGDESDEEIQEALERLS